ncbi:MAG: GDP-L-fucose synthase [Desulfobacterales bacterium]|nr:GDP-L-fucose synthase [Desulfobacterales bacterium]
MEKNAKIYVAGHQGLVGSAIMRRLKKEGYNNLITRTRAELDLTQQAAVHAFFEQEKPNYVFLAAAKVGGIYANNTYPAEFIYQNLMIQNNIIHSAYLTEVNRLLFLGSSCIYPKFAPQPMKEEHLLTGTLETTNEAYAVAKIAGIKMCEAYNRQYHTRFFSIMPTNLYGPNDNFDLENSHVLPALIRKFHEAKIFDKDKVEIWGTGTPMREFLHVDDMASACVFLMNLPDKILIDNLTPPASPSFLNIGTGKDVTIRELAETIKEVVNFQGMLCFDSSKPDGTPRKLLDVQRLRNLGWQACIDLREGIESTYQWFLENYGKNCY